VGIGARNLRVAKNTFEGLETNSPPAADAPAAIEVLGDGSSRRRLEFLMNTLAGIRGPAFEARDCGPGLVACGNQVVGAGTARKGAIDLSSCCGALVEDNEVHDPCGPGLRLHDCTRTRAHGNELRGTVDASLPRSPGAGVVVEGNAIRRIRISDNRVCGTRDAGILVTGGVGLRLVGNEVQDCGEGIRVKRARALVLVGNDCRDNGGAGIAVEEDVRRGLVALNYAALNGATDLAVFGKDVTARDNRVDREP
jgi:hypothetical protein